LSLLQDWALVEGCFKLFWKKQIARKKTTIQLLTVATISSTFVKSTWHFSGGEKVPLWEFVSMHFKFSKGGKLKPKVLGDYLPFLEGSLTHI